MYGDVSFRLRGSSYVVRFPNAAWDDLKAQFAVPTEAQCIAVAFARGRERVGVLAAAAFASHHPDLARSTAAIAQLLGAEVAEGETSARAACLLAIELALPEPRKKKAGDKKDDQPKAASAAPPSPHALRLEALRAGMTPTEFSTVTPREAVMFIEAFSWRETSAVRRVVIGAWWGEAFARKKRIGSLKSALKSAGLTPAPDDPAAAAAERAEQARQFFRKMSRMKES